MPGTIRPSAASRQARTRPGPADRAPDLSQRCRTQRALLASDAVGGLLRGQLVSRPSGEEAHRTVRPAQLPRAHPCPARSRCAPRASADLRTALADACTDNLVVSVSSDRLFPPEQVGILAEALPGKVRHDVIDSPSATTGSSPKPKDLCGARRLPRRLTSSGRRPRSPRRPFAAGASCCTPPQLGSSSAGGGRRASAGLASRTCRLPSRLSPPSSRPCAGASHRQGSPRWARARRK
jgi:hypothetical protein